MTMPISTRQPSTETGIYLSNHDHIWTEVGTHSFSPGGSVHPAFRCDVCQDVLVDVHQFLNASSEGR